MGVLSAWVGDNWMLRFVQTEQRCACRAMQWGQTVSSPVQDSAVRLHQKDVEILDSRDKTDGLRKEYWKPSMSNWNDHPWTEEVVVYNTNCRLCVPLTSEVESRSCEWRRASAIVVSIWDQNSTGHTGCVWVDVAPYRQYALFNNTQSWQCG